MVAIYISGGISGAHFNPAISIMLYIYRGFPLRKVPTYIAAQVLGAIIATMITFGIFRPGLVALRAGQSLYLQSEHRPNQTIFGEMPHADDVLKNFITFPRSPWVTHRIAFVTELTGATILTVSVLALGDDTNAPPGAGMNAFIIGLIVTLLGMTFGYNTGLALNPARDFGPRIAMKALGYKISPNQSLFEDWYWFKVACLGPLCGTILGGFIYDSMIFVGGESPVNYPTTRIKRATRKWTKRWQARFTRTKWKMKDVKDDCVGST
jgi:aquaglyceroporin related protein